jgi:hypothetical protein
MQFRHSYQYRGSCPFIFECAVGDLRYHIQNVLRFRLISLFRSSAILSQDPCNNLHESVRYILVFFQDLSVNLNGAIAELLALFRIVILTDRRYELIGQVARNLIATDLE